MSPLNSDGPALVGPASPSTAAFAAHPLHHVRALRAANAPPASTDDEPFPWVDQEFEEYFFE